MCEKVSKVSKVFTEKITKKYVCEYCDYICCIKSYYTKHLTSAKHKNKSLCEKVSKVSKEFTKPYVCECCDYICYIKSNYMKHLSTSKHEKKIILKNEPLPSAIIDTSSNEIKVLTGLVVELVQSNNDLQKQVLEICKNNNNNNNNTNSHHTNSHNNSHNKTFNLQFFLNEECKDAMNLSEFINSIQPKISDLKNIGKVGYVEGISNIIIKQLNDTHLNKRPVHCSDTKRETLYVKEENKWEMESDENKQMVKAVRDVDKKTSNLLLTEWKDMNPNFTDSKSNENKEFLNLAGKVLNGDKTNVNKVIKKLSKKVVIDK